MSFEQAGAGFAHRPSPTAHCPQLFSMNTSELIYDWNKNHPPGLKPLGPVLLNDESLRDGLQSPSVRDPSIPEKIEILHLMEYPERDLGQWNM
jgi:hypothetical protein